MEQNFTDQRISINFIESTFFPEQTFSSFGNLAQVDFEKWPKVFISLFIDELMQELPLQLKPYSISKMRIEKLTIQDTSHKALSLMKTKLSSKSSEFYHTKFTIFDSVFSDSRIKTLEIIQSNGFMGFRKSKLFDVKVMLENLIINQCKHFSIDQIAGTVLSSFSELHSLRIVESNLKGFPENIWINTLTNKTRFEKLKILDLEGNNLETLNSTMFHGIEQSLEQLSLSNNSIKRIDWSIFQMFPNLKQLNLSYNPLENWLEFKKMPSFNKNLEVLSLKGLRFDANSLKSECFRNFTMERRVIIELDEDFECNCFLFTILKNKQDTYPWILKNDGITVPKCYKDLYLKTNDYSLIKTNEEECDFSSMLNQNCEENFISTANTKSGNNNFIAASFKIAE